MRRNLVAMLAALALAIFGAALTVVAASPAQAGTCTKQTGTAKKDPFTGWSWTTWWICGNATNAPMYGNSDFNLRTGYMESVNSWFVCWRRGAQHAGGNNVWYYSKGDSTSSGQEAHLAWGYIPAVHVYTNADPLSGMAQCPEGANPPVRVDGKRPVILLHGFEKSGTVDCKTYWDAGQVKTYLLNNYWPKVQTVSYYPGPNCDVRLPDSSPDAGTTDEDISDLGAAFAWYVYNNYSRYGVTVDVIAHSMGGLVTRAAIAGTAHPGVVSDGAKRGFPPYLYIEDVATLSTPFQGASGLISFGCWISTLSTPKQCTQLRPGSSFIAKWITPWGNPQSKMGTDWSVVGSEDDQVVDAESALDFGANAHPAHKYWYPDGEDLGHGNITNSIDETKKVFECHYTSSCSKTDWGYWPSTVTFANAPINIAAQAVVSPHAR